MKINAAAAHASRADVQTDAAARYAKQLVAHLGRKLEFTLNSKPSPEGAWTTRVEPVAGGRGM